MPPHQRVKSPASSNSIEITTFKKSDGPLTKRIGLAPDGTVRSDGSACLMAAGSAQRTRLNDLEPFADHIDNLGSDEAIALGTLRGDLPDNVKVITKRALNGTASLPDLITRTADYIIYRPGQPALALIDIDIKDIPRSVRTRLMLSAAMRRPCLLCARHWRMQDA
jgi:hypothetical protein